MVSNIGPMFLNSEDDVRPSYPSAHGCIRCLHKRRIYQHHFAYLAKYTLALALSGRDQTSIGPRSFRDRVGAERLQDRWILGNPYFAQRVSDKQRDTRIAELHSNCFPNGQKSGITTTTDAHGDLLPGSQRRLFPSGGFEPSNL